MKKLLIVLFGVLAFQGYVFAESWEDRAASKTPWSSDFPDDPACWNPIVEWNTENPWVVGMGSHDEYRDLSGCISVCAAYATCYRKGYDEEEGAHEDVATCGRFLWDQVRTYAICGEGKIAKRCKTIIGIIEVDDEEECTIVYDGEILLDE